MHNLDPSDRNDKPFNQLIASVRQCQLCASSLPFAPKPIIHMQPSATLLIIGQAPGMKVQQTGIPWNDASGKRLRNWLNISSDVFYNKEKIAIMPMGFCYPGKGPNGDLPPSEKCAAHWHQQLLQHLPHIQLTLLIGQYAQRYYLTPKPKTLTETVRQWQQFAPTYFPLPHPSPRNQLWLKRNDWFEKEVIPILRKKIDAIIHQ